MFRLDLLLLALLLLLSVSAGAQYKVTIIALHLPANRNTDSLFVAGNFNNWSPGNATSKLSRGKDNWNITLNAKPGDIIEFKFTRGDWSRVETLAGGEGRSNRTLKVMCDTTIYCDVEDWSDSHERNAKQHTATEQVRMLDKAFLLSPLGKKRRIWVYLPKDYGSSRRKYPVLYMQDGQNLFDEYYAAFGEWKTDKILNAYFDSTGRTCIVIGIDNGGEERITEYNPYDHEKFGKGEGRQYVESIVKSLKPYVDKQFRTLKDKKNTWIAGSSMGGLIAMYAVATFPKTFGGAGILSPSFWIAPALTRDLGIQLKGYKGHLFFYCGGQESLNAISDMDKVIAITEQVSKADVVRVIEEHNGHNEASWSANFPAFLELMFRHCKSR